MEADLEPAVEGGRLCADAELRDMPGPVGTRRRPAAALELLYLLAVTDFKRTYFGTLLGYLWSSRGR